MGHALTAALGLLAAVLVTPAHGAATIVYLSSFDVVDSDSGTAVDGAVLTNTIGGGTVDADLQPVTSPVRQAANGGAASSARSLKVNVASGGQAYVSKPAGVTLNGAIVGAFMAYNIPTTLPTGEREIASFREGANEGCNFRIQAASGNKALIKGYYGNTLIGTSREAMYVDSCSGNEALGCFSAGSDCPAGNTCGTDYWAELEFRQQSAPGPTNRVACDLWWHGRQQWASTFATVGASGAGNVTDVWMGAPGTESVALLATIDDVVVGTNDRVGRGWVGFLAPNANGASNSWGIDNCGGGAVAWQCVDDYASGGQVSSGTTDTLRASAVGRLATIAFADPAATALSIAAVEWDVVGRTSATGSGTWTVAGQMLTPNGTKKSSARVTASVTQPTTTPVMLVRNVEQTAPDGDWTTALVTDAQLLITLDAVASNETLRLSALGLSYFAKKTDIGTSPKNLHDHDPGTNDGAVTAWFIGDSLAVGTAGAYCSNATSVACSADFYCSWDSRANGLQADHLCSTNTECRTCTGQRANSPNFLGFECTSNADCPAAGTCDTGNGVCADNGNVPCTTNADCALGGTCDTTATCVDACPGTNADGSTAVCPPTAGQGSWAKSIVGKVNLDNIIVCGAGGERLDEMLVNRWPHIVANDGNIFNTALCWLAPGSSFADPDYIIVQEGVNNLALSRWGQAAPTCAEASAGDPTMDQRFCGGNCTTAQQAIQCDADSDCSAVSADSRCVGVEAAAASTSSCLTDSLFSACSMRDIVTAPVSATAIGGCNQNSDCGGSGTCTINDSTSRKVGFCNCSGDGDCAAGFLCVGSRCRRSCTTDGNCKGGTPPAGQCIDQGGGRKVCAGRCTCPCNARSCTTNADCTQGTGWSDNAWWSWKPRGKCVAGKCTECGPDFCPSIAPFAYAHTASLVSPDRFADMFDYMRDSLTRVGDPGDGRPILIEVEHPETYTSEACSDRGTNYADGTGWLRNGTARLVQRGHRVVQGQRTTFESYNRLATWQTFGPPPTIRVPALRSTGLNNDEVHYSVVGGNLVSDNIAAYLGTLNACTTGSGTSLAPQRYCYDTVGAAFRSTTCAADTDCSAARDVCAVRPCTGAGDCPDASDSCNAE